MYDAVIIGGGPSGITAAARIAQLGGKACIVEKAKLGGVCTNWGCIPTKALVSSARNILEQENSTIFGVKATSKIDFKQVVAYRDKKIKEYRNLNARILKGFGVEVIHGEARILNKKTVMVGSTPIKTKNIIYCTGSRPTYPSCIELTDKVLTSKQLVSINTLPKKLTIVGGGVIGCEFATIFNAMGSKVTIIESADKLLFREDPEISKFLKQEFEKQGITVLTKHHVISVDKKHVHTEDRKVSFDTVLVATGRTPVIAESDLGRVGVKYDKTGIFTDNKMRTSVKNIYATGDATGKSILAHVGIRQGMVAAHTIMGKRDSMSYTVPRCIFSLPEVSAVGKTEAECTNPTIGIAYMKHAPKAILENEMDGFVKVLLEKNKIVGFQIAGHLATELINEATLIVTQGISPQAVVQTIHPHPTMGEVLKYAVEDALGEYVEAPPRK